MASSTQKWLIGCGVGCGFIILVTALVGGGIFFAVKDVIKDGEAIEGSFEALEADFGSPQDFVPAFNGAIPADRMEAFLAARDAAVESREKISTVLITLDDDGNKFSMDKIKAGLSLVPSILTFIGERNQHLLNEGMGLGEYGYIYSLAYFNYLDKDLTDGPSFSMTGDDNDGGVVQWSVGESSGGGDVDDSREKEIRKYMHRLQMALLDNQIDALSGTPGSDEAWRAILLAEKEAMESHSRRLLWEEGLPDSIAESLAPFADRLEASYVPVLNALEAGLVQDH